MSLQLKRTAFRKNSDGIFGFSSKNTLPHGFWLEPVCFPKIDHRSLWVYNSKGSRLIKFPMEFSDSAQKNTLHHKFWLDSSMFPQNRSSTTLSLQLERIGSDKNFDEIFELSSKFYSNHEYLAEIVTEVIM